MSINTPAAKEAKNAALDLEIKYTSPLTVNVHITWLAGLIMGLFKKYGYLFFLVDALDTGLRYWLNKAQVLGPTLASALRLFAF